MALSEGEAFERKVYRTHGTFKKKSDHGRQSTLTAFQKLRRLQEADWNGICSCISCGKREHYTSMDGGHYREASNLFTQFWESNVWPQCKKCNAKTAWGLAGNLVMYRKKLIEKIGFPRVYLIEECSQIQTKITSFQYAVICNEIRLRIKPLSERLE